MVRAAMDRVGKRVRAWQIEGGDTQVLAVARILFGLLLFWQALTAARALHTTGYFGDFFHIPMIPEALVPSRGVYVGILAAQLVCAALAVVGQQARLALLVSAVSTVYVLLCDRLHYHHNRYALACYAFLLALSPCDRTLVLGHGDTEDRFGPLWAQRLAQLQVSIIYLASGGSKLLDADWRNGLVLLDRMVRYGHIALDKGIPQRVVAAFQQPLVASGLAKAAIATELLLAVGLWVRRWRAQVLWWGVMFHLTIQVTSQVELFTWTTLVAYALFATPDRRARKLRFDPSRRAWRWLARGIKALDWLSRYDLKPWEPDGLTRARSIVVVRRDGTIATGLRAAAMVARTTPLLFPLWGPLALVASFTKGGDAGAGS